jgi:hypothetical protein
MPDVVVAYRIFTLLLHIVIQCMCFACVLVVFSNSLLV